MGLENWISVWPLGNQANPDELKRLVDMMALTTWHQHTARWRRHYVRTLQFCPGKESAGADFV